MEIVLLVTIGPTLADVSLMVIRKLNMGLGTTCCSGMKTQGTFFLPRAGEAVAGFEQQNHTFGYCCWCSNAVPWDMESNSTSAQPERGCSSLGCWKCALAARAAGTASTRLQQSPLCCLIACSPRWVICPHGTEDCLHPAPKRDSIFLRGQGFDFPWLDFVTLLGTLPGARGSLVHEMIIFKKPSNLILWPSPFHVTFWVSTSPHFWFQMILTHAYLFFPLLVISPSHHNAHPLSDSQNKTQLEIVQSFKSFILFH